MVTMASELSHAMTMIWNGEADSWHIGDDGHITVTKQTTYGEAVAAGHEMTEEQTAAANQAREAFLSAHATDAAEARTRAEQDWLQKHGGQVHGSAEAQEL